MISKTVSRRAVLRAATAASGACFRNSAFAAIQPVPVEIGGGLIEVYFDSDQFDLPRAAILDWVRQCAGAVTTYMGKFPVPQARIQILLSERGRAVVRGTSWGGRTARCRIAIGRHATVDGLNRDWVLTHEMLHFAFPNMPEANHWIEEGISTYVEPIARVMAGLLHPAKVWADMLRDMPKGLPADGDGGLDFTHTWGRTYWGGALFCLLADVGIRKATGNRSGLRDALRAINGAGGNITTAWPLSRALEIGDKATGATVLADLHQKMGASPYPVDLAALWKELGVRAHGDQAIFDPRAPLAEIRASMIQTAQPA